MATVFGLQIMIAVILNVSINPENGGVDMDWQYLTLADPNDPSRLTGIDYPYHQGTDAFYFDEETLEQANEVIRQLRSVHPNLMKTLRQSFKQQFVRYELSTSGELIKVIRVYDQRTAGSLSDTFYASIRQHEQQLKQSEKSLSKTSSSKKRAKNKKGKTTLAKTTEDLAKEPSVHQEEPLGTLELQTALSSPQSPPLLTGGAALAKQRSPPSSPLSKVISTLEKLPSEVAREEPPLFRQSPAGAGGGGGHGLLHHPGPSSPLLQVEREHPLLPLYRELRVHQITKTRILFPKLKDLGFVHMGLETERSGGKGSHHIFGRLNREGGWDTLSIARNSEIPAGTYSNYMKRIATILSRGAEEEAIQFITFVP